MAKIEDSMKYVLVSEGGYVDDPLDRGHATNLGITISVLAAWRGHAVTKADVKALTVTDATAIYKKLYWDQMDCDDVDNQGCATAMFDMSVNFGVGGATVLYERALSALSKDDVNDCAPADFIKAFEHQVEVRYAAIVKSNPSQIHFYKGWMNRAHRLLTLI